ncbi:coagulase domain-containing protein [Staphylococcus chromogenes]|uniref:coagulase domain-containing protein n=1 Tax=Staphylococcus chromogenes TaxID=46126 RepID=UPI0013001EDA|nr:coagulase domain-containing protein [Staphylococcus chromogenes]
MKKKLLVLSASAILASNFTFDNNASAVVKKTEHESEALKIVGNGSDSVTREKYEDNFKLLTQNLSLNEHDGYDEVEYKDAYQKYQDRFLAELDAFNKLILKGHPSNGGMTVEKYNNIRKSLEQNKQNFMSEAAKIENEHKDLKRFDDDKFDKGLDLIYNLEDQALMSARAFGGNAYKDAREDLYAKLDLIVGTTPEERRDKLPTNQRMLDEMSGNLETIIDEFFKDIKLERPVKIEPLTKENKDNLDVLKKVREDAQKAKEDARRDPNVELRAKKAEESLAKITENSRKAKAEANKKAKEKSMKKESYKDNPKTFPHKQLKQQYDSKNELVIKEPTQQLPTYTVTTERQTQPVLKQKQREETFTLPMAPRQSQQSALKGMGGESNHVTTDSDSKQSNQYGGNGNLIEFIEDTTPKPKNANNQKQTTTEDTTPEVKETITESNVVDIDQSSFYQKSGYKYGYSESDTSGYTNRDKRAIKRNLVREAEEKVNQYVNSQSAQDLVAAREKVKTLDSAQQTRLNKQIDKIYNGQY